MGSKLAARRLWRYGAHCHVDEVPKPCREEHGAPRGRLDLASRPHAPGSVVAAMGIGGGWEHEVPYGPLPLRRAEG
jgi:hypothetical protein